VDKYTECAEDIMSLDIADAVINKHGVLVTILKRHFEPIKEGKLIGCLHFEDTKPCLFKALKKCKEKPCGFKRS
jgi:hypothetical protein